MKLTIGEVKTIISEVLSSDDTYNVNLKLKHVNKFIADGKLFAHNYVSSVTDGNVDSEAAEELQKVSHELKTYVQFLKNNKDLSVFGLYEFSNILAELAELSEFWNRPSFIGKKKYAFTIAEKLNLLLSAARKIKIVKKS